MAAISTLNEPPSTDGIPPEMSTAAPQAKDRFVKHANLMSALTIVSRVFGLVRDKVCATYLGNGTTWWSAFWMGFQLPNLFRRIFGEGALTAIFVPLYTRVLKEQGQAAASRLAAATSTLLVLVLGGLTLLGEAIMIPIALHPGVSDNGRLAAAMIAIMLPYCVTVCLVALMGAMATVHEKFTAQSISPVILNLFMTAAVLIATWLGAPAPQRVYWVAFAVIAAGVVQVLQMLPTLRAAGIRLWPGGIGSVPAETISPAPGGALEYSSGVRSGFFRNPAIAELIRSMIPMMLGLSAVQFNTYMDTQIAWWLSPDGHNKLSDFSLFGIALHTPLESGAVGILSVAQRLYLLPVGIFGVSMAAAIFPLMSKAAADANLPELKRLLIAGLRKTLFLSLPASVGMILIARPLITLIYSSDGIDRSTWAAIWFCAGIWAFEGQMVILRAFYAMNDRITPMKVAVAMVVLNFSLNLTLVWTLREGGIALSTTISAIVQAGVLLLLLRRRLGLLGLSALRTSLFKGLIASGVMGTAAWATLTLIHHLRGEQAISTNEKMMQALIVLPAVILVAALTYGGMAMAMRMPELKDVPVVGRWISRRVWPRPSGRV